MREAFSYLRDKELQRDDEHQEQRLVDRKHVSLRIDEHQKLDDVPIDQGAHEARKHAALETTRAHDHLAKEEGGQCDDDHPLPVRW